MTKGVPFVARVDDIITGGREGKSHLDNIRAVLQRFQKAGLKLNWEKGQFFRESVTYLAHVIDKNGIRPSQANVKAIQDIPAPKNLQEVQSFIGAANYYAKFIPNMSTLLVPMNCLRKKGQKFEWSKACQEAFDKVKQILLSPVVLTHYDPQLKLVLQCDASPVGVGAVLSHIFPDGTERPIAFVSRTLSTAEKNYSQIQLEALSIVFGVTRLHQYLFGTHFLLRSDHKPLIDIFGPKAGIPVMAANRLQRWAIKLSAYNYELCHIPGSENGNADMLSRLPVPAMDGDIQQLSCEETHDVFHVLTQPLSLTAGLVAEETGKEKILRECIKFAKSGWPSKLRSKNPVLRALHSRRHDLSTDEGILMVGQKVVVPAKLREMVLEELHSGHPAMTRMKMLARSKVWWPSINEQIEAKCRSCSGCNQTASGPTDTAKETSWVTAKPWERLHVDFAGPISGRWFLILVDSRSNWPEVTSMSHATAGNIVTFLRHVFSQHGLPRCIVTDNGTPFTAEIFVEFCRKNGINHLRTAPYHPASNGEAEKTVHIFKRSLFSQIGGEDEITKIQRFLPFYRSTPCPRTGKSPSEILNGRNLCTRLDLLKPSPIQGEKGKDCGRKRAFSPGDQVWVLNHPDYSPKWVPGKIIRKESAWIYHVEIQGSKFRRHLFHLRTPIDEGIPENEEFWDLRDSHMPAPIQAQAVPANAPDNVENLPFPMEEERRYPARTHRPVDRMGL